MNKENEQLFQDLQTEKAQYEEASEFIAKAIESVDSDIDNLLSDDPPESEVTYRETTVVK